MGLFTCGLLQISIAGLALIDALLFESRIGASNWRIYNTSLMAVPTSICFILNGTCLLLLARSERLWHGKPH